MIGANKLKTRDHIKTKVGQAGPSKPEAQSLFKDTTELYGLKEVQGTNFYAVDFNNDNWTDLVVLPNFYSIPEFYEFNPLERKFKRITYEPFKVSIKYSFLIFADLDKDGILDLIGGNLQRKTEVTTNPVDIYKAEISGRKVRYKKIEYPFDYIPKGPSSIALFDYDLDGELDIYMGNWFDYKKKSKVASPDMLYKGKGFKFTNVSYNLSDEYSKRTYNGKYYNATPTFSVASCDINQDGWPDILTASSAGYHNKLWINKSAEKGKRKFIDFGKQTMFSSDDDGKLMPKGGGEYLLCFVL